MDKVGIYKCGEVTGIQKSVHARLFADGTFKEEMMNAATRMLDTRSCCLLPKLFVFRGVSCCPLPKLFFFRGIS